MGNFRHKRDLWGILYSKPVLIILGLLVLGFAWNVVGFASKLKVTKENKRMIENRVSELQGEKEVLSAQIAKLETEAGVEENIRTKFGLAKEGERVVVVVEEKGKVDEDDLEEGGGLFLRIKGWFSWLY